MRALGVAAVCLALLSCSPAPETGSGVDLVLHNGRIWTGDTGRPWAEWVAVSGDRIVSVGSGDGAPDARERIDLAGRLTVPGFNDTHVHFASAGSLLVRTARCIQLQGLA